MVSFLPIRSPAHDHHHHINCAIQAATSPNNLDVNFHSSDGSIVSTNRILLSLFSPFLTSLLSSTPTPACLPTCIILPDFSTASIIDLVALLYGGVGISKFPRSDYVHAVRDVIDVANLLGITPGQLVDEPVGLGETGISNSETIDQQINAATADENQFGVELPPLFELSQAYVENELALLENDADKLDYQKSSDSLLTSNELLSENLQRADHDDLPPRNNCDEIEFQFENEEHKKIIQQSSKDTNKINQCASDEVASIKNHHRQNLDGTDQQMNESAVLNNNLDGEYTRSHQSFDDSLLRRDLDLSDSSDDSGNDEGFKQNVRFPGELSNDTTTHDGKVLNGENENKELIRIEQDNGHKVNQHETDKHDSYVSGETIAKQLDAIIYDENGKTEFTKTNQDNSQKNVKNETMKDEEHDSDVSGETVTKQQDKKQTSKTKSLERPKGKKLKKYKEYLASLAFLHCDVCQKRFISNDSRNCPSCSLKIKDKSDNICKDINMNISITNHSESDTEKKLIAECTLQSERVKTTSKRSRSFSQNRDKEKKNGKKRKASSKELIKNKFDSPPKYSVKKSKEDNPAAKDHTHYGARKHPCNKCSNCIQKDCGDCIYCKDKPKFGGPNKKKQKCKKKLKCLQPVTNCYACKADKSEKDLDQPGRRKSVKRRGMPCGYKHLF